jgi:hypothetical protein
MSIVVNVSGFLFLLIIVLLNIATGKYGYEIFSELDSDSKLKVVHDNSKKFRTGILLAMSEHVVIILLAISLFIAFYTYNILLGVVWAVSRSLEGLIQIYNKKNFLGLINISDQYASSTDTEKVELGEKALSMLKSKNSTFTFAQILFSIGTLAYSIVFVVYDVIPWLIGWLGIIAGIIYGLGNGIYRVKESSKILWNLGGLLIFIFELILGGWLLFGTLIFP